MKKHKGAVACGHPEVAHAAEEVLRAGGNAFDAVVAAQYSACVVEPVLTSLGGGGYLTAYPVDKAPHVYDFFVQTPQQKRQGEIDFYPIVADFGDVTQEFHIGTGSIATPGTVKGAFEIHRDLCSMPMTDLVQVAVRQAKEGVAVTPMQAYIFEVVGPIYQATESARKVFEKEEGQLPEEGDQFARPELAITLDQLAIEGERLFYEGEMAQLIVQQCRDSGHLTMQDLQDYEVIVRDPLKFSYRDATVLTNPPPSFGGILIAFAMQLLGESSPGEASGSRHVRLLNSAMALTQKARIEKAAAGEIDNSLLDPGYLKRYHEEIAGLFGTLRGTTHISVVDGEGNIASMTLSNGEGCGTMVPGTGFMLNNMLGEEDINPNGFGAWRENMRMASMMSPTILIRGDDHYALGSGGSNRIRSAILQVVSNLVDFDMSLADAIEHPRIHFENDEVNVEAGFGKNAVSDLEKDVDRLVEWSDRNLFFGGVHGVEITPEEVNAHGDPRRGGVGKVIT